MTRSVLSAREPMRIALFTDTYPPQVNGVARTLARLVGHLSARGHQVALTSPAVIRNGPATDTVLHHQLGGWPIPVYPELLFTRPMVRRERKTLGQFNPHVVHCATESIVGWSGRRWALKTGRPLVTSFHTNFPEYAEGYGMGFLAPTAWRLLQKFHAPAVRTLCPSSATFGELRKQGFDHPLGIWARGVDTRFFRPTRRSDALRRRLAPGAEVVLLFVGRLAREKRIDLLLESFELVRARVPKPVGLVVVGDGPLRDELRRKGPPGVHFTGYLSEEELARAYASADIFAFPSDTETFGNVVLEAMASGLPVAGVDRGGVKDTIEPHVTGFRAHPGDPKAFADALLTLIERPALRARMATAARSSAEARGWDRILDGVIETYEEALSVSELT